MELKNWPYYGMLLGIQLLWASPWAHAAITVDFDEPTENEDGTPLHDLCKVRVTVKGANGKEVSKEEPAVNLDGGGHHTMTFSDDELKGLTEPYIVTPQSIDCSENSSPEGPDVDSDVPWDWYDSSCPGVGKLTNNGDYNGDGVFDISDAIALLQWLYSGGEEAPCFPEADYNDDGKTDITDAIKMLKDLFNGGGGGASVQSEDRYHLKITKTVKPVLRTIKTSGLPLRK